MARLFVVSVRDAAVQAFMRPFFVPSVGAAVRSFTDEVNRKAEDNPMARHPEDFELWLIGVFDEENGQFSDQTGDGFRCLSRGKDVVRE